MAKVKGSQKWIIVYVLLIAFICNMLASYQLSYAAISIQKIELSNSVMTLEVGEIQTIKAVVMPGNASNKSIKWSSSDDRIVKINSKGKIKALKKGKAIIRAKSSNGITATCKITVKSKSTKKSYKITQVMPEIMSSSYTFTDDMAKVKFENLYGYINRSGKNIIPCIYKDATKFSEGYAMAVKEDDTHVILDKKGNETIIDYSLNSNNEMYNSEGFKSGIIRIYDYGKRKRIYFNTKGKIAFEIEDKYRDISYNMMGYVGTRNYGELWLINDELHAFNILNTKGEIIHKNDVIVDDDIYLGSRHTSLDKVYCDKNILITKNIKSGLYGALNYNGKVVIDFKYYDLGIPSEERIAFKNENKYGFLDYNGKVLVKPIYDKVGAFSNGLACVQIDGNTYFIDKNGKEVLFIKDYYYGYYSDITYFDSYGFAVVTFNRSGMPRVIIDKLGNEVFSYNSERSIGTYTNDMAYYRGMINIKESNTSRLYKIDIK